MDASHAVEVLIERRDGRYMVTSNTLGAFETVEVALEDVVGLIVSLGWETW